MHSSWRAPTGFPGMPSSSTGAAPAPTATGTVPLLVTGPRSPLCGWARPISSDCLFHPYAHYCASFHQSVKSSTSCHAIEQMGDCPLISGTGFVTTSLYAYSAGQFQEQMLGGHFHNQTLQTRTNGNMLMKETFENT